MCIWNNSQPSKHTQKSQWIHRRFAFWGWKEWYWDGDNQTYFYKVKNPKWYRYIHRMDDRVTIMCVFEELLMYKGVGCLLWKYNVDIYLVWSQLCKKMCMEQPQNKHELLIALCFYPFCLRQNPTGKGFKSMSFQTGGRRQCNVELLGCEEWCWGASRDVLPK